MNLGPQFVLTHGVSQMDFAIKLATMFAVTVLAVMIGLKIAQEANTNDWPLLRNYDGLTG